jgi:hypothetical protein
MHPGHRHSPEARRRIAEATRAAMAAPAVRQKISERTKLGMRTPATELKILRGAWRGARSRGPQNVYRGGVGGAV